MVDYLPSKKTIIIGHYYAKIVFKLYDAISQKRRGKIVIECAFFVRIYARRRLRVTPLANCSVNDVQVHAMPSVQQTVSSMLCSCD